MDVKTENDLVVNSTQSLNSPGNCVNSSHNDLDQVKVKMEFDPSDESFIKSNNVDDWTDFVSSVKEEPEDTALDIEIGYISNSENKDKEECVCDISDSNKNIERLKQNLFDIKCHDKKLSSKCCVIIKRLTYCDKEDMLYFCTEEKCGKGCTTSKSYECHKSLHTPDKPDVRNIDSCDDGINQMYKLEINSRTAEVERKCSNHHVGHIDSESLQRHTSHSGKKDIVHQFDLCKKSNVEHHSRFTTCSRPYICSYDGCNKSFAKRDNLRKHYIRHTRVRHCTCQFDECDKSFLTNSELARHVRTFHAKERPFSCPFDGCDKKYASKNNLKIHVQTFHYKERQFSCHFNECNKKYISNNALTNHIRSFHSKERRFSCHLDGCNKSYFVKINLQNHIRSVHSREQRFSCLLDGCNKSYAVERDLKNHIQSVHFKERSFCCQLDGCDQRFSSKYNLKAHVRRVHSKERKCVCHFDGCNKSYYSKSDLTRHLKGFHYQEKSFSCLFDGCHKKYCSKRSLRNHVNLLHSEER